MDQFLAESLGLRTKKTMVNSRTADSRTEKRNSQPEAIKALSREASDEDVHRRVRMSRWHDASIHVCSKVPDEGKKKGEIRTIVSEHDIVVGR